MTAVTDLDGLTRLATAGDRSALERLVAGLRDDVYGLAMRMLWHPEDAEDATQEILVRIVTGLGSFRGDAAVRTWAYRVAANHLLTTRRRRLEQPSLDFDAFAADLADGLDTPYDAGGVDDALLAEEVRIGCTQGMLLCLDRPHRLAYILADVLELSGPQGAAILELAPAAYRKRVERARRRVQDFVRANCGIVAPTNPCRCERRVGVAIQRGRVDPERLVLASHPRSRALARPLRELVVLQDAAALFRSDPAYRAPEALTSWLRDLLDSGTLTVTT